MSNTISAETRIFTTATEQTAGGLAIQGRLPDYVRGIIYMNGPARFQIGDETRRHWLDGDGMVRALDLAAGEAAFTSRYVQTKRYVEENEAGRRIYRSFGTAFQGDSLIQNMSLASPANVSAYPFGPNLLAFGEQSLPWLLDPFTLDTLGEQPSVTKMNRLGALSAHPKFDGDRMANFGIRIMGPRARLFYYEFGPDLEPVVYGNTVLSGPCLIHDFAISEHYAVFHVGPYFLDARKFLKQGGSLMDSLKWNPTTVTELVVIQRSSAETVGRIPLSGVRFCLHLVNAYDHKGEITVDLIETEKPFYDQYIPAPHMFSNLGACSAVRIRLRPGMESPDEVIEVPLGRHADFPSVPKTDTGRPSAWYWALGMPSAPAPAPKFYNELFRFDPVNGGVADQWTAGVGECLGAEPVVMCDPDDADRCTIGCQLFIPRTEKASWVFFDGHNLAAGPVARVDLPAFDPPGFHTCWRPNRLGVLA
ncbi:MAG: carotenoid oxygenase family protein [Acidobacteriota bacterium]|nr:carotenoid oxygenase family protein [Acidobacteriota bacterium]